MTKENIFNKEEFADLLERAKGDRSINRFAEETGVSAAHISRFLRSLIEAPPTPETISKFSSKAYNDVSYRDLMAAAGHIAITKENGSIGLDELEDDDSDEVDNRRPYVPTRNASIDPISPNERRMEMENLEKRLFQVILSYLYEAPFQWNMQKPDSRMRFPDMIVDIDDEKYSRWLLEFKAYPEPNRGFGLPPQHIYGRLAMIEFSPKDKFTIVVNSERAFQYFLRRPPVSIRANIYVMLVDIEKGRVLTEEQLSSYEI
ncbi:hypothetical protein HYG86_00510 [Alkalicella caledoniensis]|uniref:Uncharacterized protein n=1 Tax=Alkalicella caledoniensis TaxID=2731377 RepID=A0A7G9W3U5_ALKCA|nr:hypothetical protein [Alkalicella caledoniensis]QNO13357.1 hypothetical protein HYG86_00510 [Alkalicella caledoniensis]